MTRKHSFSSLAILAVIVASGSGGLAEEPAAPWADQVLGKSPQSITGNPVAESNLSGVGDLGRWLHIPDETGLHHGDVWLGDSNGLISGGAEPGK